MTVIQQPVEQLIDQLIKRFKFKKICPFGYKFKSMTSLHKAQKLIADKYPHFCARYCAIYDYLIVEPKNLEELVDEEINKVPIHKKMCLSGAAKNAISKYDFKKPNINILIKVATYIRMEYAKVKLG